MIFKIYQTLYERTLMLATYLLDAGLLTRNELDAANTLVRSAITRGTPLAIADALVQLNIISAPTLMALTFLQQLDRAGATPTAEMLRNYLTNSGALTAEELERALAAQRVAHAAGKPLTLCAALVRTCNLTLPLIDQRVGKKAAAPALQRPA